MNKPQILLLSVCSLSAFAQTPAFVSAPAFPDPQALAQCVATALNANKYASASETASHTCRAPMQQWMMECQRMRSPRGFSDLAVRDCEAELRVITDSLNRGAEEMRPKATKRASAIDKAIEDLNAGRPLPGLPDLKLPVYLNKGELACNSLGALKNPQVGQLLLTRSCIVSSSRVSVSVLPPVDPRSYLESHVAGSVRITWRAEELSNGNVNVGWVKISGIRN